MGAFAHNELMLHFYNDFKGHILQSCIRRDFSEGMLWS